MREKETELELGLQWLIGWIAREAERDEWVKNTDNLDSGEWISLS